MGLPGQDGIETLKQIVAGHADTATIMISGQATVATAVLSPLKLNSSPGRPVMGRGK